MKKAKKKILIAAVLIIMILGLAACASQNTETGPTPTAAAPSTQIQVTDIKGNVVTLEKIPERIVSLSPSNTELLFDLGVGDKVVGVTSYCDYPEAAKAIQKIGTFDGPNLELIQKVKPDVVLAGGYIQEELIKKLQEMNTPVISTEATDINGIFDSLRLIGKVTATESKAEEIIAGMQKSIDAVKEKTKDLPKKKIFYVAWTDPITTAGSATFINDIIKIAGGINVAEKAEGWAKYSTETLISDNPDILISSHFATDKGIEAAYYSTAPVFKKLDCVKKGKVYIVSDDNIMVRPTPRVIQAIEEIVKALETMK